MSKFVDLWQKYLHKKPCLYSMMYIVRNIHANWIRTYLEKREDFVLYTSLDDFRDKESPINENFDTALYFREYEEGEDLFGVPMSDLIGESIEFILGEATLLVIKFSSKSLYLELVLNGDVKSLDLLLVLVRIDS